MEGADPGRVRVWDLPVRLVHWLIVVLIATSWWTAETGRLDWHRYSGYGLLGLLLFRLYWGFFGSSTARFARFVRGPRAVWAYLRSRWDVTVGHNPLGALSVVALFTLLALQIGLGLIAVDVDGIESGPLSLYVGFETGRAAAEWHETIFDVLMWLTGLHVVAVFFYVFVKKQNLVGAMFTGMRRYDTPPRDALERASAVRFIVGVVFSSVVTWMVAKAFQF